MENPNEPTRGDDKRDPLRELQAKVESALDDVRPKIRRALEELESRVDEALNDIRPRAQAAVREVQPRVDQFVADVQPRLDGLLERLQQRIEELRRDLDARAARTGGGGEPIAELPPTTTEQGPGDSGTVP